MFMPRSCAYVYPTVLLQRSECCPGLRGSHFLLPRACAHLLQTSAVLSFAANHEADQMFCQLCGYTHLIVAINGYSSARSHAALKPTTECTHNSMWMILVSFALDLCIAVLLCTSTVCLELRYSQFVRFW